MPARLGRAAGGIRAVPLFRRRQAGPVAWDDRHFKGFGWRGGFGILADDLVAAFCTLLAIAHLEARMVNPLCEQLAQVLQARGWMLATAESCTGGMIAAACTDLSGSSNWFERGFVSYSNAAKTELLGVDPALIASTAR
jgi:hypothetical protein